jgi:hypothetical protein
LIFLPCTRLIQESVPSSDHITAFAISNDVPSVDGEFAVSAVVKGLAILLRWIDPSLQHFENEHVIPIHETCVGYFAFEIGKAFSDERGPYRCGWYFGQSKGSEFVGVAAG